MPTPGTNLLMAGPDCFRVAHQSSDAMNSMRIALQQVLVVAAWNGEP
jgi:hypothetical protein